MKVKTMRKVVGIFIVGTMIGASLTGCAKTEENEDREISTRPHRSTRDPSEESSEEISDDNDDIENSSETVEEDIEEDSEEILHLAMGDTVTFGSYEQDNNTSNGAEPIEWQVADIQDGKALLISNYILDYQRYNEPVGIYGDTAPQSDPWHESDIFSWLNNDFKNSAFTEEELRYIVYTTDPSSEDSEVVGDVFLLSYEEAVKYFGLEEKTVQIVTSYEDDEPNIKEYALAFSDKAMCRATEYALDKHIDDVEFTQDDMDKLTEWGFHCDPSVIGKSYSGYWLRSSFKWEGWFSAEGHAYLVEEDGTIETESANFSNEKTHKQGIRPCVWVSLDGPQDHTDSSEIESTDISEGEYEDESKTADEDTSKAEETKDEPGHKVVLPKLADPGVIYGYPGRIEVNARTYSLDADDGVAFSAEVDIADTGSSYMLGVDSIRCNYRIRPEDYEIRRAVEKYKFTEDESGNRTYDIIPGEIKLSCLGDRFALVSYTENNMGRGTCEFIGEDGKTYYLYNDISSLLDDFTSEMYFKLVDEDGQDAYKEIKFDESTYIEIPYDMAEGTGMAQFAAASPDINSGNPGGHYNMQLDSHGNIVQLQGW